MTSDLSHTVAILGFNAHDLTLRALKQLRKTGCKDQVLFFDNGSQPAFENMLGNDPNIRYIRSVTNIYVNPAWNLIFDTVETRFLTLLNNDCFILSNDYFGQVLAHMDKSGITLSSAKTYRRSHVPESFRSGLLQQLGERQSLRFNAHAHRQGWLMTIDMRRYRMLDYRIPQAFKIWYGDDWIWAQVLANNLKAVVYRNRYAFHLTKPGLGSPALQRVFEEDCRALRDSGDWYTKAAKLLHHRTRLFSRYV